MDKHPAECSAASLEGNSKPAAGSSCPKVHMSPQHPLMRIQAERRTFSKKGIQIEQCVAAMVEWSVARGAFHGWGFSGMWGFSGSLRCTWGPISGHTRLSKLNGVRERSQGTACDC